MELCPLLHAAFGAHKLDCFILVGFNSLPAQPSFSFYYPTVFSCRILLSPPKELDIVPQPVLPLWLGSCFKSGWIFNHQSRWPIT